uniref:Uncharacterized protein n=1 Tax=Anguilla anguilla TaxID=7936 RepID=A0A0E9V2T0_ANGAN
MQYLKRDP